MVILQNNREKETIIFNGFYSSKIRTRKTMLFYL